MLRLIKLTLALALLALVSQAPAAILTSGAGGAGPGTYVPPVGCASTGVYDLSNVCNDIYFIGALK